MNYGSDADLVFLDPANLGVISTWIGKSTQLIFIQGVDTYGGGGESGYTVLLNRQQLRNFVWILIIPISTVYTFKLESK